MQCPKCGSENTHKRGVAGSGNPRIHCNDCGSSPTISDPDMIVKARSVLYDADGNEKLVWEKTQVDKAQQDEAVRQIIAGLISNIPPTKAMKPPAKTSHDLLTLYPVGDHHFGCLAHGEETTGHSKDDNDLGIQENVLRNAMEYLVKTSPNSDEACVMILGDFMHFDSLNPVTSSMSSSHILDSDSRYHKVVRAALRGVRHLIKCALQKHRSVRLIVETGNHDEAGSVWLAECFYMFYGDDPRITVDNSPRNFHILEFGKNLLGCHHGQGVKMPALPLLFATDYPEIWGRTTNRVIHTGHVHHDQIKEYNGVTVESHGVLGPIDSYAAHHGYRSRQSMKSITYHREFGEEARFRFNPEMLE